MEFFSESKVKGPKRVERFLRKFYFMNNMFNIERGIDTPIDIRVPTTEHAYQMSKFIDDEPKYIVANVPTGMESKATAQQLIEQGWQIRKDWEESKFGIMLGYNRQKFSGNRELAAKLIGTGSMLLVEGNNHGDRYWGVDPPRSNNGANHLGEILMIIRDDLQSAL